MRNFWLEQKGHSSAAKLALNHLRSLRTTAGNFVTLRNFKRSIFSGTNSPLVSNSASTHIRTFIASPRCLPTQCNRRLSRQLRALSSYSSSPAPDSSPLSQAQVVDPRVAEDSQKPRLLTAAEREWLQEEDVVRTEECNSKSVPPRFDWRGRAASRIQDKTVEATGNAPAWGRFQRSKPESLVLFPNDRFFEELDAYKKR